MVAKQIKRACTQVRTQQATTRTVRGHKRPSPELAKMLALVNLVPAGVRELPKDLPHPNPMSEEYRPLSVKEMEQRVAESFAAMPSELADLRAHLLDHMTKPGEWLITQEMIPSLPPQLLRVFNAIARYGEIRRWRATLRAVARRQHFVSIETQIQIDWSRGTFRDERDRLGIELEKVDLNYIRECVICGRLYLAPRITYQGVELKHCSEKCARAVRNKRYQAKRPPARKREVEQALMKLKKVCGMKKFKRTTNNVADLADWANCTIRQTNRVLDFLSARDEVKK